MNNETTLINNKQINRISELIAIIKAVIGIALEVLTLVGGVSLEVMAILYLSRVDYIKLSLSALGLSGLHNQD